MKNLLSILLLTATFAAAKPNIVLIMSDDLGAEACSLYGADEALMPNTDAIAAQGVRFTEFHASTQCTPSRGRLLTARDASRTGLTTSSGAGTHLYSDVETTIADVLKGAGYKTGIFGKWHVWKTSATAETLEEHVSNCGFDEYYVNSGNLISYGDPNDEPNFESYKINQAALSFITTTNQPFFALYVPHLPHSPYTATPLNPSFTGSSSELFREMIKYHDVMVSNILAKIESEGIATNTVIIYLSDNGTPTGIYNNYDGTNIEGGKTTSDFKGTRVPAYMRWDGQIPTGTVYNAITDIADIPVTLAQIAGASMPAARLIDGRSFLRQVKGEVAINHRRTIFFGNQTGYPEPAVWNKNYKLGISDPPALYSITNWPYGDALVGDMSLSDSIGRAALTIELRNATNLTAETMNPWGGHTNERAFLTTP